MRKVLLTFFFFISLISYSFCQSATSNAPGIIVTEEDASPSFRARILKFSNGSLNNNGDGSASISSGSGTSQWVTNGTAIYYGSGNVGIGITAPTANLHVDKSIYLDKTSIENDDAWGEDYTGKAVFILGSKTTLFSGGWAKNKAVNYGKGSAYWIVKDTISGAEAHLGASDHGGLYVGGASQEPFSVASGGLPYMIINQSGNVGLYTHDNALALYLSGTRTMTGPSQKLYVEGTIYSTGNVGIGSSSPQAALDMGSGGIRLGGVTNTSWPSGTSQWTGTDPIYYTSGNVGIGTSVPVYKLAVEADSDVYIGATAKTGVGQVPALALIRGSYKADANADYVISDETGVLKITNWANNTGTVGLTFGASGIGLLAVNVGIGSSAPRQKLDVEGAIYLNEQAVAGAGAATVICRCSNGQTGHVTGGTVTAPTCTCP